MEFLDVSISSVAYRKHSVDIILWFILISSLVAIQFTLIFAYFALMEGYYGTTIGKRLLGLQVVNETGLRITWQQAVMRNLSKSCLQYLLLDWLVGLIGRTDGQRGLDVLAKAKVIETF
ncbi:MAG: RDD family protein [Candidatus Hodarchaeota archaeon]